MSDPCGAKACSQCGETKPSTAFATRRASRDGFSAYCKACGKAKYITAEKKARARRRRGEVTGDYVPRAEALVQAAKRRVVKQAAAQARAEQPRKPDLGSRDWYARATPAQVAAYRLRAAESARRRYAANVEKGRAKVKRWKRANPGAVARHHASRASRQEANADGSITRPAKAKLLAAAVSCGYCGDRLDPRQTHFDHAIPLARGGAHRIENLVVCCSTCNLSKGSRTTWEWVTAKPLAA